MNLLLKTKVLSNLKITKKKGIKKKSEKNIKKTKSNFKYYKL